MTQATQRVTKSLARNLRRRGALPALLTALGLVLFVVAQLFLQTAISLIGVAQYPQTDGLYEVDAAATLFQGATLSSLTTALPFAFGFFVSLWIVAPISDELALRFVIARGILAGGVGLVLVVLTGLVLAFASTIEAGGTGSTLGYAFPWDRFGDYGTSALAVLVGSLSFFVVHLAHVILASVAVWHWLRTHERSHSVSGILDEM